MKYQQIPNVPHCSSTIPIYREYIIARKFIIYCFISKILHEYFRYFVLSFLSTLDSSPSVVNIYSYKSHEL